MPCKVKIEGISGIHRYQIMPEVGGGGGDERPSFPSLHGFFISANLAYLKEDIAKSLRKTSLEIAGTSLE